MFNFFKDEFVLANISEQELISEEVLHLKALIKDLICEKFSSSLTLCILDSGSCNGCELELQMLFSPLYDLASCGIQVGYDSSKADMVLLTGLLTENMSAELEDVYKTLREPKWMIMLGDCPISFSPFHKTFALKEREKNHFERAFHIGGCPPSPLVLLQGLHEFLKKA
ncbi:MAG: Formate hydrogenlyase subunit 7 [uncultured Sulfurovum sp.]|uniref:Formate hydrogenlyase subunit 7 n=1 Tax=uncultured Sulfurovum sp. TaxID=269237 RepID=A0A6S6SIT1_9BACT|nr:MAG: Formate hydrogenlyase subunit 7 [uncultured Sulfurovum sp.]